MSCNPENMRFNFDEIKKFVGEDEEALKNMLRIFLKSVPETLAIINKSFAEKDLTQFCYYAHKLKSSIDTLSITELKEDIRTLENAAIEKLPWPQITELVEKLNLVLGEILPEIKEFVN